MDLNKLTANINKLTAAANRLTLKILFLSAVVFAVTMVLRLLKGL